MLLAVTFVGVMETIGYILLALLALMFMVVVHESGHYLAGKLLGFKILEFSIGFGPAIFKKKSKKTGEIFAIRPIPLGGYCQFEDEDADSNSPTAFNNQKPWKRLVVLFSGAFFNLISAWIIITLFFTFNGQLLPTIAYTYPDSLNENVLEAGDVILRVDGKQMNVLLQEDVSRLLSKTGDTAEFVILRNGERMKVSVSKGNYAAGSYDKEGNFVYEYDESGKVKTNFGFGFASSIRSQKLGFFRSLGRSFSYMFFLVYKILAILGQLITGQLGMESIGGPVTTIGVISEATRGGFSMLMYAVCLISANLAVMNLLPIPALDGSKMLFCLIEWIFKKKIPRKVENTLATVGMVLLFGFAIFADLFQFIRR